jgi:chorismate synthase
MLRFLTAGESHGPTLVVTVDGMPAGLTLDIDGLNAQLRRRQGGYGRGRRMQIESDRAEIVAGVRHGVTTGAPIALLIRNRDWVNWQQTMYAEATMPEGATGTNRVEVTRPRPGHADLAGAIKYGHDDIRNVLERASARETAARVAAGTLARQLLGQFGVRLASHVSAIGPVVAPERTVTFAEAAALADDAPLRCVDAGAQQRMMAAIDAAKEAGDTLGGAFEVIATGLPPGLGSYVQWDRKLDGRLGQALLCIHAIKAVGIGIGPEVAWRPGSRVHDEILRPAANATPPVRPTNNAGGLEGGVTNGEDVRVTGFMKPIATLMTPLRSVDLTTLTEAPAAIERSDVCAVPAAAVVGEAMVAFVLADAFLEKFGGDSVDEIGCHYAATADLVRRRFFVTATVPVPAAGSVSASPTVTAAAGQSG